VHAAVERLRTLCPVSYRLPYLDARLAMLEALPMAPGKGRNEALTRAGQQLTEATATLPGLAAEHAAWRAPHG
jgi:hypothetical protein